MMLTARRMSDREKRRNCQVQPHAAEPAGCRETATHEMKIADATSWLCERHFWEVKAQLDAQAPVTIIPAGETVH